MWVIIFKVVRPSYTNLFRNWVFLIFFITDNNWFLDKNCLWVFFLNFKGLHNYPYTNYYLSRNLQLSRSLVAEMCCILCERESYSTWPCIGKRCPMLGNSWEIFIFLFRDWRAFFKLFVLRDNFFYTLQFYLSRF